MSHYGKEFLDCPKIDGMHGSYFEYEEYLELDRCATSDDFRALLDNTEFAEVMCAA